ncbi:hypothetical protein [Paraburkholderia sediminicola]|uniref:hypothetical protein n=1 Tax=Paraburkholderia sediminicola TaxID=458836 RepID=UPI0015837FCD|nr:hypothetical protein [Paraburkholderia sediminicola]
MLADFYNHHKLPKLLLQELLLRYCGAALLLYGGVAVLLYCGVAVLRCCGVAVLRCCVTARSLAINITSLQPPADPCA